MTHLERGRPARFMIMSGRDPSTGSGQAARAPKTALVALLLAFLVAFTNSASAQVLVRTSVKPEGSVVLGQHVRVLIDVLFPGEMPRPPRVAMPDMAGAQILRYETQATTMNERVDGTDRVGQRFEFALYPRRGGMLDIPAPQVTLLDRDGGETGRVAGTPMKLEVTVPAGVDPSRPVVATTGLELEQRWQPDPAGAFKAGDALVRTITRQAADIPGMAMLELVFTATPGVRIYIDPPQTDDRVERGDLTGHRTDRVTYVFERGGSFPIEAVVQPWWDLEAGRLRRAEGQGATVAVTAVAPPSTPRERLELWLYVATTAAGLLALSWWAWPLARSAYQRRRACWMASETRAFKDLQQACRHDDARAVYRAFTTWRQRADRGAELAPFAEEIELAVFASQPWSAERSRDFAGRLAAGRHRAPRSMSATVLPPLNPA